MSGSLPHPEAQDPTTPHGLATKEYVDSAISSALAGGGGTGGTGSSSGLSPVQTASPQIGDVVTWNGSYWTNAPIDGGNF